MTITTTTRDIFDKSQVFLASKDEVKAAEYFAIKYCDTDQSGCLTLDEVKECVKQYVDYFPNLDNLLPTEGDFNKMPGEDKCLTLSTKKKRDRNKETTKKTRPAMTMTTTTTNTADKGNKTCS